MLRQTAGANGFSLNVIKYDRTPQGIEQAINDSVGSLQTNDTIYIPEGGPIPGIILSGLGRNGVDVKSKQVLGSGNWESVKASDPHGARVHTIPVATFPDLTILPPDIRDSLAADLEFRQHLPMML